jgi:site-specific recombinase XerD/ribosomal protein L40E
MTMDEKIMDHSHRLANVLGAVRESSLPPANRQAIEGFADECLLQGLSKARVTKFVYDLLRLAEWLGMDFQSAGLPEIKQLVRRIDDTDYVPHTKMEYRVCLRKLYKWLRGSEELPPEMRWIRLRPPGSDRKTVLPEDLLTQDDVLRMMRNTRNARDRAFMAVLYETGCRIGELLFLRLRSIQFDVHGAVLSVPHFGKTGARRGRIISSVPYPREWLNRHPQGEIPEAYLWPGPRGEVVGYARVRGMLREAAASAHVLKRVNPHSFRHARATHLANHLTEAQMKEYFGWVQASAMAAVYVHLSGRNVDDAILKLHGKADLAEEQEEKMVPKVCSQCSAQNPATNRFCSACGMTLDRETADQMLKSDWRGSRPTTCSTS